MAKAKKTPPAKKASSTKKESFPKKASSAKKAPPAKKRATGRRKIDITLEEPECPDNKFHYSFTRSGAQIQSLTVDGFSRDNPPDSDDFITCIDDPNTPPSISVTVTGTDGGAGGTATFSLSFNGKDVFKDREVNNKGGGALGFTESVKLP